MGSTCRKGGKHMVREIMDYISSCDEAVGKALYAEYHRQQRNLELIASENIVSPAVMLAMGTVPTNKYAEGYPEKRYYGGCEEVDVLEDLAIERAKKLFGAEHACVQPHSGASANLAVYQAFLEPGDTVMGMNLAHGGHLTHGSPVNISGRLYHFVPYNVNADGVLDYEEIRRLALEHQPKMIVAGASAYPREIRFDLFAEIAKEVGAYLFVDMAHIAGLVAAGLHQNPVLYADVVSTTTHKTLRGPRGGMILCKKEYAKQIDKAIFPGTQGGPLMHVIAAKAVCFGEALKPEFRTYQEQVVKNAKALSTALMEEGFHLVSNGTDNHLMLVDLQNMNITGKELQNRLDNVYITVNKNAVPNDPASPFVTSGIRIGTPAVTTRGLKEEDMKTISHLIKLAVTDFDTKADEIRAAVNEICSRYPIYE